MLFPPQPGSGARRGRLWCLPISSLAAQPHRADTAPANVHEAFGGLSFLPSLRLFAGGGWR